jgi:hypothetical protein
MLILRKREHITKWDLFIFVLQRDLCIKFINEGKFILNYLAVFTVAIQLPRSLWGNFWRIELEIVCCLQDGYFINVILFLFSQDTQP